LKVNTKADCWRIPGGWSIPEKSGKARTKNVMRAVSPYAKKIDTIDSPKSEISIAARAQIPKLPR